LFLYYCLVVLLVLHSSLHDALPILSIQLLCWLVSTPVIVLYSASVRKCTVMIASRPSRLWKTSVWNCAGLVVVKIAPGGGVHPRDRKSTRLNSSHRTISYAVFCLKK